MKLWWIVDSGRVTRERRLIDEVTEEGWFRLERWGHEFGLICAYGVIVVPDAEHPVKLMYPDQFPLVPAWVEPQTPARLSGHQYGEGVLCLELRPDNWVPSATGADVLRSARNLLATERRAAPKEQQGEVPSAGHMGDVQAFGMLFDTVLLSEGCAGRIREGTSKGLQATWRLFQEGDTPIYVFDDQDLARPFQQPASGLSSGWFPVSVHVAPVENHWATVTRESVRAQLGESLAGDAVAKGAVLLIRPSASYIDALYIPADAEPKRRQVHQLPGQAGLRSNRAEVAAGKRVGIVGAGSIGSKIAESLVRSGVLSLVLVDGDVFFPGNLERHVLDWRHIGLRKVNALASRIAEIAPAAVVNQIAQSLNWQKSAKRQAEIVGALADCDVIVDATADHAVSLVLGAVAYDNNKAFVAAEVLEGGVGVVVASCVPGRDAPYAEAKANFLAWCEQQGVAVPQTAGKAYEALSEDGSPIVADDAAVTVAAAHAARVILDIVDGNPAPAEAAWLLIGLKKAWLFKGGHGDVIRIGVGAARDEPAEPADESTRAFLLAVLKDQSDEG